MDDNDREAIIKERIRSALKEQQQDDHLAAINGSIGHFVERMSQVEVRLGTMEKARERETAISEALETYLREREHTSITQKTLWLAVIAIVTPVVCSVGITLALNL